MPAPDPLLTALIVSAMAKRQARGDSAFKVAPAYFKADVDEERLRTQEPVPKESPPNEVLAEFTIDKKAKKKK